MTTYLGHATTSTPPLLPFDASNDPSPRCDTTPPTCHPGGLPLPQDSAYFTSTVACSLRVCLLTTSSLYSTRRLFPHASLSLVRQARYGHWRGRAPECCLGGPSKPPTRLLSASWINTPRSLAHRAQTVDRSRYMDSDYDYDTLLQALYRPRSPSPLVMSADRASSPATSLRSTPPTPHLLNFLARTCSTRDTATSTATSGLTSTPTNFNRATTTPVCTATVTSARSSVDSTPSLTSDRSLAQPPLHPSLPPKPLFQPPHPKLLARSPASSWYFLPPSSLPRASGSPYHKLDPKLALALAPVRGTGPRTRTRSRSRSYPRGCTQSHSTSRGPRTRTPTRSPFHSRHAHRPTKIYWNQDDRLRSLSHTRHSSSQRQPLVMPNYIDPGLAYGQYGHPRHPAMAAMSPPRKKRHQYHQDISRRSSSHWGSGWDASATTKPGF